MANFTRRIPEGEDRERLICGDCGYVAYENPKVVVGAVVTAVDRSAPRLRRLHQNLERIGLKAEVVVSDAAAWDDEAHVVDNRRQYRVVFRDDNATPSPADDFWQARTVSSRVTDPTGTRYAENHVRDLGRPIVVNDDADRVIVAYRDNQANNIASADALSLCVVKLPGLMLSECAIHRPSVLLSVPMTLPPRMTWWSSPHPMALPARLVVVLVVAVFVAVFVAGMGWTLYPPAPPVKLPSQNSY